MLRLLAKVNRVRTIESFSNGGLKRTKVYCYATIKSAARSTFKMPRGLKGKSIRVTRTYVHPWQIKAGDLIVLDPEESQAAIKEHVSLEQLPPREVGLGEKRAVRASFVSDGLKKYVVENAFIRSVISPEYGARVSELYNFGTGLNELHGGGGYGSGGYVLLGGVEESLTRVGKPPDLWNASYKKTKMPGFDLSFEHKPEKKPGLKHTKSFFMLPDAPVLCQLSTFEFKPKTPRKKKGKKSKLELTYVPRIFFGIGEETGHTNLFFVPTAEELVRMRYNVPAWEFRWGGGIWDWRKKWHAVRPGYVLLANEKTGECMAVFADPRELSFAWLGNNLGTPRLYMSHLPRKLKPKSKISYGMAISVGVAYDLTKNSLLLLSEGRKTGDGVPLAIVYRGVPKCAAPRTKLSVDGSSRIVELKKKRLEGIGDIFFWSFTLQADAKNVSVELAAGRERLRVARKK